MYKKHFLWRRFPIISNPSALSLIYSKGEFPSDIPQRERLFSRIKSAPFKRSLPDGR